MELKFYKYEGTGNDFILVDNREENFNKDKSYIELLCNRKFGIGADGLILLEDHDLLDFEMRYFNSDGKEATMCGNGGRCIVAFAKKLGIINNTTNFNAVDGVHEAEIFDNHITLKMNDVKNIEKEKDCYFLDTGSPHFVCFVNDINKIDTFSEGRKIRYNNRFKKDGTNVNFVEMKNSKQLKISTYERGVEEETLSCGTGAVATAIASYLKQKNSVNNFQIITKGGLLKVFFEKKGDIFKNIFLQGEANLIFEGIRPF